MATATDGGALDDAGSMGDDAGAGPCVAPTENSLCYDSTPRDYIGGGRSVEWSYPDITFSPRYTPDKLVELQVEGPSSWGFWSFEFEASDFQVLGLGVYDGATRYPFNGPNEPGLSVGGGGRGCNMLTGSFEVLELEVDAAGELQRFRANFIQHCEGGTAYMEGQIRYSATTEQVDGGV
ncbi:MAG: hypothetical protein GXP55_22510 [Deltaproteobacteria bacterium]|nr:hypothetical protein [Deltaproteobacteria bacterium]